MKRERQAHQQWEVAQGIYLAAAYSGTLTAAAAAAAGGSPIQTGSTSKVLESTARIARFVVGPASGKRTAASLKVPGSMALGPFQT